MENKLSYWAIPSFYIEEITAEDKKNRQNNIIKKVCLLHGVTLEDLKGKSRKRNLVVPRQIILYLFREVLNYSLVETAKLLNRKHCSVLYSVKVVNDLMDYDNKFRVEVNQLSNYTKFSFNKSKEEESLQTKTSKFKGVSWKKNHEKWVATIYLGGAKQKHLGSFKSEIEAHLAYKKGLKKYNLN